MKSSSPSLREIEFTIHFPCAHFRPASITLNFEESTISGTRAQSGSEASKFRNRVMAACPSNRPSSKLTSTTCAPFSTWARAIARASSYSPFRMCLQNLREPATLQRSPTLTNPVVSFTLRTSRPESNMISEFLGGFGRGEYFRHTSAIAYIAEIWISVTIFCLVYARAFTNSLPWCDQVLYHSSHRRS